MTKKQRKQAILTILALILCIGGYFVVDDVAKKQKIRDEEESSKVAESNQVTIYSLESIENINQIQYVVDDKAVKLSKDDNGSWINQEDKSMKIDNDAVDANLKTGLMDISGEVVDDGTGEKKDYGFEAPINTIKITFDDGTENTIYIGEQNPFDASSYYLMKEGDNKIYVVNSGVNDAFSKDAADLEEETTTVEDSTSSAEETTQETNDSSATE